MQGDLTRSAALTGLPGTLSRIPTPAGFAALANVPLRAGQSSASRQATLEAIGFLRDIHALNPIFRNAENTTLNGVAIETAQTNIPLSRPSGVTSYQSGQPFTIVTGVDSNGNGAGGDRPNFNPSGAFTLDPLTGDMRSFRTSKVDGRYLVPLGANGSPLAFSLGNGALGKNTLRAVGFWNSNLSLSKRVRVLEGHALTLRVDMLNAFNQDNYGIPDNSLNSLSFGRKTNNWGNRTLTLGAKYTF